MNISVLWRFFRSVCVLLVLCGLLYAVNQRNQPQTVSASSGEQTGAVSVSLAKKIFPEANSTELLGDDESGWTIVRCPAGKQLGMVVNTSPMMDKVMGYGGFTPVLLGFDQKGVITAVELLDNFETPSFVRRVIGSGYLKNWLGMDHHVASTARVDAVTSATKTSESIAKSIRGRLKLITVEPSKEKSNGCIAFEPLNGKTTAIVLLVLSGIVLCFSARFLQRKRLFIPARYILLMACVGVLGVASATMFSMSLLKALAIRGRLPANLAVLAIVGAAVLIPVIVGRNVYCHFMCPFGGVQELIYRLSPFKRIRSLRRLQAHSFWRRLRYVRFLLLLLLIVSMVAGVALQPDSLEPFAAFRGMTAGWAPVGIAVVALLLSLMGWNRFWCKYGCSSGALLDLLRGRLG
jgi:hypothetical protein